MDLTTCELPGIKKLRSGKVREVFDLGDHLLLVATDRISAFDCILPTPIPGKGKILTKLSEFWFEKLDFVPNHFVSTSFGAFPEILAPFRDQLEGRSTLAKKCTPLPVECVARGFLAGSAWEEYRATGRACGHDLPPGLRLADRLPETLFTPARKASSGHDENISWRQCRAILGDDIALLVKNWTIELYEHARAYAEGRGIILADTKFEFGLLDGEVVLIDEALTPDSSRFWPAGQYAPGSNPPSFDKQFVRDYLASLDWDKTPPAPPLPDDTARQTAAKYREALEKLAGPAWLPAS
jgi:phosphoribosylaminoimidazole-succinocarboxamide synthase